MKNKLPGDWTRRRLLRTLLATLAASLAPRSLKGLFSAAQTPPPFSRFVEVARAAGLTQATVYGGATHATYIIEVMGPGCASFDFDNDGWMDIFTLNGRRLEALPGLRLWRLR